MATYTQMVDMILDWSNREIDVLPYSTIKTVINFAADNAYRTLRIAPLEAVKKYAEVTQSEEDSEANKLSIPSDAIEFIQLRKVNDDSNATNGFDIYAAKSDIRSFYQPNTSKYSTNYYTRERNNLILNPNFSKGDKYELFYYRRLPETDARYDVTATNNQAGILYMAASKAALMTVVQDSETSDVFTKDPDLEDTITEITGSTDTNLPNGFYLGKLATNWLRDENEKVLLYGALEQTFIRLNEPEQAQSYGIRFQQEIEALNREEKMRMVLGGTLQTHFTTQQLI